MQDPPTAESFWDSIPTKPPAGDLQNNSEKDKEGIESHVISSGQQEHFSSGFIVG